MNIVFKYINKLFFIERIARWIKQYEHPMRVFGGIFFFLAFGTGILWAGGKDLEPVAFLFSMISSMFFAAPSIALWILPNRKLVKDMNIDEIMNFIETTNPADDWTSIGKDWSRDYFLKEDPRLRFKINYTDEGTHSDNFQEEWATRHPHSQAVSFWVDLYYDTSFIDRRILVSIDGGRALLPPPDLLSKKIKKTDYKIARIFDAHKSLDEYIGRSRLEVGEF